jgi:hypothetical protein
LGKLDGRSATFVLARLGCPMAMFAGNTVKETADEYF